jgi:hypothetical protein
MSLQHPAAAGVRPVPGSSPLGQAERWGAHLSAHSAGAWSVEWSVKM